MARIAHLTDLHLIEDSYKKRSLEDRLRLEFLSLQRRLDPSERHARVARALAAAKAADVDHVVITGDLTEDGMPAQYERLAGLLHGSGIAPERITLLPGNHDLYAFPNGFRRALFGPLSAFAATSDDVVDLKDLSIVLLPTARPQNYILSAGEISVRTAKRAEALIQERANKPVMIAMHHPLRAYKTPWMQGLAGLRNRHVAHHLLAAYDHTYAMHGHTHKATESTLGLADMPRVFSAPAVVDHDSPLRVYELLPTRTFRHPIPPMGKRAA